MKNVLVVGTKGDQPRRLNDRLRGVANVTCIAAEDLSRRKIPNSDYVVLWSKFISHKHRDLIYDEVERDKIMLHFGGVTQLAETIERLVQSDGAATVHLLSRATRPATAYETLAV